MTQGLEFLYFLQRFIGQTLARIYQHRIGVQGYIGSRPGFLRRRQIVRIGFTGHLEYGHGNFICQCRFNRKPFGFSPGFEYLPGMNIARLGFIADVMEGIKYQ